MIRKIIFLFLLLCPPVYATTVVLQEGVSGYSGTSDTYLDEDNPTTNYGSNTTVVTQNRFGLHRDTGWLKFLVTPAASGIPSNAIVSSAVLTAKFGGTCNDAVTIYAYRALKTWLESSATWNSWNGDFAWGSGGGLSASDAGVDNSGDGTGSDTKLTETASVSINECTETFHDFTITSLVQGWIDGSMTNNGVFIKPTDLAVGTNTFYFISSENSSTADRPYLTIIYTAPGTGSSWYGTIYGTLN